ncbi:G-protein coupled receptor 151 [Eucyclogobius newberryi]|uniref:G-protein coupled receptor 151 n=1 Tax=Eucyclogobius newberryi TaxID=166745 RepID=UPI003B58C616
MEIERPSNVTLFDFVGGLQLLRNGNIRTAIPVILIGVCVCGALCNLLVLLVFIRDFRKGRGSEVKALLASLASADLLILLLCAPVRAVTYYKQIWTLGSFVCRTADWFQHSCIVAKTLILAATTRSKHTFLVVGEGGFQNATWIHGALVFVWLVAMFFSIPQLLFASLVPYGGDEVLCVSEMPVCASDFASLFYKIYPTAAFVVPVIFTLAYYTKTLHGAVNNGPNPRHQSKVTLVLLCLSGAQGLMLLPEWGTFTWIRLGFNRPPAGLLIFANVLFYTCSLVFPVLLMTMYDDVRQGLVSLCYMMTCRPQKRPPTTDCSLCVKPDGNGAEACANEVVTNNATDKTFPDVEHFWTGRRNTHVEDEQDPVPWERDEKMLQSEVQSNQTDSKQE